MVIKMNDIVNYNGYLKYKKWYRHTEYTEVHGLILYHYNVKYKIVNNEICDITLLSHINYICNKIEKYGYHAKCYFIKGD